MTTRVLVQTDATAALAAVAGLAAATPVAAAPELPIKGCESAPGGASATADGWVLSQPTPDAGGLTAEGAWLRTCPAIER
jgi:hypothetical protein